MSDEYPAKLVRMGSMLLELLPFVCVARGHVFPKTKPPTCIYRKSDARNFFQNFSQLCLNFVMSRLFTGSQPILRVPSVQRYSLVLWRIPLLCLMYNTDICDLADNDNLPDKKSEYSISFHLPFIEKAHCGIVLHLWLPVGLTVHLFSGILLLYEELQLLINNTLQHNNLRPTQAVLGSLYTVLDLWDVILSSDISLCHTTFNMFVKKERKKKKMK